jgi:hypothetical protein
MIGSALGVRSRGRLGAPPRLLLAPWCVVMTQRFAMAGLVASFAVRARAVHGLTDARIGASFSLLLVVFAAGGLVHAVVTFALAARCRALAAAPIPLLIPISRPIGGSAATNEEISWRREQ